MVLSKHSESGHAELEAELVNLIMDKVANIVGSLLVNDSAAWKGVLHKSKDWRPIDKINFDNLVKQISPLTRYHPEDIPQSSIDSAAKSIMEVCYAH